MRLFLKQDSTLSPLVSGCEVARKTVAKTTARWLRQAGVKELKQNKTERVIDDEGITEQEEEKKEERKEEKKERMGWRRDAEGGRGLVGQCSLLKGWRVCS